MHEEPAAGIPEWVVTFGDMMSLLLTFFIMLVSLSEMKQEEKYQALVDAMRRRFGYESASASMAPGAYKPRNSSVRSLATAGRAQRLDTHKGGDKSKAPVGEHPRVRIIRPGKQIAVGVVIYFPEGQAALNDQARDDLRAEAPQLRGKPQRIEIRGHASRRPVDPAPGVADHWDLAYRRCRETAQFLIHDLGLEPARIRMAVAGANEPAYAGEDPLRLAENPRVEVFMLDEIID